MRPPGSKPAASLPPVGFEDEDLEDSAVHLPGVPGDPDPELGKIADKSQQLRERATLPACFGAPRHCHSKPSKSVFPSDEAKEFEAWLRKQFEDAERALRASHECILGALADAPVAGEWSLPSGPAGHREEPGGHREGPPAGRELRSSSEPAAGEAAPEPGRAVQRTRTSTSRHKRQLDTPASSTAAGGSSVTHPAHTNSLNSVLPSEASMGSARVEADPSEVAFTRLFTPRSVTGSVASRPSLPAPALPRRRRWAWVVLDPRFELVALCLIVLNTIFIAAQTDYTAHRKTERAPLAFIVMEACFCACFVLEVLVRIAADSTEFFKGQGRLFNLLDCILIVLQIAEVFATLLMTGSHDESINMSVVRAFRITRAIRIGRSVRLLWWFQEVRTCCMAVVTSIRPFIGAVVILGMAVFITGVYYTEVALTQRLRVAPTDPRAAHLDQYFGSLSSTVYSLFMAITGGLNWEVLAGLLSLSNPGKLAFSSFIAFCLFVLFNVITGVVIKNVMTFADEDQAVCLIASAQNLFAKMFPSRDSDNFKDELIKCMFADDGVVTVEGLAEESAQGNGKYERVSQLGGRPVYMQVGRDSGDALWIYCIKGRQWCLGRHLGSSDLGLWATIHSDRPFPPSTCWEAVGAANDPMVKHATYPGYEELKVLLGLMRLDTADVENIFTLCEAKSGNTDMASFLGMYAATRATARRLDQLILMQGMTQKSLSSGTSTPTSELI